MPTLPPGGRSRTALGLTAAAAEGRFALRAYVGYAGWSPGQLENELRMNAWVVCPFDFACADFEGVDLWKNLLAAHRPELRLEADSPEDPGLN